MEITLFSFVWVASVTAGTLLCLLWFFNQRACPDAQSARDLIAETSNKITFVYSDTKLLDATDQAYDFLRASKVKASDWSGVFSLFSRHFPNFSEAMEDLANDGSFELNSADQHSSLKAEFWDGLAKITLEFGQAKDGTNQTDQQSVRAMEEELLQMRTIADANANPVWMADHQGTIQWVNNAYLKYASLQSKEDAKFTWPLPHIFGKPPVSSLSAHTSNQRMSLEYADENGGKWFDVVSSQVPAGVVFHAVPADEIVQTKDSLSSFTQTLTKTFAQLKQGLAIFDSDRNLMMFNPALVKLTNMPAEKLCMRPSLWAFLDGLREQRMIPEPKDYSSWRSEISELEAAAETDSYCKVWQLPSGLTYRVTGRPHPGGAIAILFENISEEISLTRRFNSHLEQNQSVLDAIDDAIVVFSASGVLIQYNKAYQVMWDSDPDQSLIEFTASDALKDWRLKTHPSTVWGELTDFIYHDTERSDWDGSITTKDNVTLDCHIKPLFGGATMVQFSPRALVKPQQLSPANSSVRA